jgi:hypothetical protein
MLSEHELIQKTFALGCLEYLRTSKQKEHCQIYEQIIQLDITDYYVRLMEQRIAVITQCESKRAIRAVIMARTLPREVALYCHLPEGRDGFIDRTRGCPLPENLHLVQPTHSPFLSIVDLALYGKPEWLFFINIDYVFPIGFFYLLLKYADKSTEVPHLVVPVAYEDPDGRYIRERSVADILAFETPDTHIVPTFASMLNLAKPVPIKLSHIGGCREGQSIPWTKALKDIPAALIHTSHGSHVLDERFEIRIAPDCFVFHLWHSSESESSFAGLGQRI